MLARVAAVAAPVCLQGRGELSLANVFSGVLVARRCSRHLRSACSPSGGATPCGRWRPSACSYFVVGLVLSNIAMTRDPPCNRSRIRTGVVGQYPLRVDSIGLMTFLANRALTPGMMPIEFDDAEGEQKVIYLHVTRMHERAKTVATMVGYEEPALRPRVAGGARRPRRGGAVIDAASPS